jgi:hypothetical protein
MTLSPEHLPLARKKGLLIERLSDEVLVYDLDRKKAHCLNQAAALIWDHCDGKTSVEEMARILQKKLNAPADLELVHFGLREIGKKNLLDKNRFVLSDKHKFSRRELIRRIGLAASVPLVMSVLAPRATAVASCVKPCTDASQCSAPCTQCVAGMCS